VSGLLVAAFHVEARANEFTHCVGGADNWTMNWELVAFGERAELADSTLNPDNLLAQLPRETAFFEARPDIALQCSPVTVELSPRFQVMRTEVEGILQEHPATVQSDRDEFINKALLRLDIGSNLSLEASRQALLWGPSLFFSPSNPFTSDNGRNTPNVELKGEDFLTGRVYLGDSGVLSLHDNFAAGETHDQSFERTYALTYEYLASDWTATLVISERGSQQLVGGFAQHTLNDYMVLFTDIGVRKTEYVPVPGAILPARDGEWLTGVTLGAAYSFLDGSNLSAEYFYNEAGLDQREVDSLLDTGQRLRQQIEQGLSDPLAVGMDTVALGQSVLTRPGGLRRHYIATQYNKNDIASRLDAVVRWTYSADDGGSLVVVDLNSALTDYSRVFVTVLASHGGNQDEFRQFYRNRITAGASLLF
jgi:hypothetical protein